MPPNRIDPLPQCDHREAGQPVPAEVGSKPRLLDQVRDKIRTKHYSLRTEEAYLGWIKRFVLFHGKRHRRELGSVHVEAFLSHLAVAGNVAASTQNQALAAILFLYKEVLKQDRLWLENVTRAKRPTTMIYTHVLNRGGVG